MSVVIFKKELYFVPPLVIFKAMGNFDSFVSSLRLTLNTIKDTSQGAVTPDWREQIKSMGELAPFSQTSLTPLFLSSMTVALSGRCARYSAAVPRRPTVIAWAGSTRCTCDRRTSQVAQVCGRSFCLLFLWVKKPFLFYRSIINIRLPLFVNKKMHV